MKNVYGNHSFGENEQRKHQLEHFGGTTMGEQFVATPPWTPPSTQYHNADEQLRYIAAVLSPSTVGYAISVVTKHTRQTVYGW